MGSSRPPPRTQDFFPAPALSLSLVRRRRSIILSIFSHKKKTEQQNMAARAVRARVHGRSETRVIL
jgi:hypothetical protein